MIGCIDGTHVRIQAPKDDEKSYVNRKNFHSINVMAVCDDKGIQFMNIYPTHLSSLYVHNLQSFKNLLPNLLRLNEACVALS